MTTRSPDGRTCPGGRTTSSNFPVTLGAFDTICGTGANCNNNSDAFVAKLNAAGDALAYATFLGGDDFDQGLGIAVDGSGNPYVTGVANSANFPMQDALQPGAVFHS